jgi:exonuclease VII small subunit
MQFIVEQQAQFWASVQKHDEQIAEMRATAAKTAAKHDEEIATLTNLVGRLAQAEIHLVERMEKLESGQQEMRAAMTQLFERMDRFIQGLEGDGHKRG